MGSETSLWACFKKNMRDTGEFDRHEDKLNLGVPDVSYVMTGGVSTGWIELKHVHKPPVRPDTLFSIKHFTKEQKAWLMRRGSAGDNCWLLLQVDRGYYLFNHGGAQYINLLIWEMTKAMAVKSWENGMAWGELAVILRSRVIMVT